MTIESQAVRAFGEWLPDELVYSAEKAGYDRKITRAKLPLDDRQSMYGFLSTEWFNHQHFKREGVHHVPHHGMGAQLQLAKFAAGLFDKVALAKWQASSQASTTDVFRRVASETATWVRERAPWNHAPDPTDFIDAPFGETPFAEGVHRIMSGIVMVENTDGIEREAASKALVSTAMDMGGLAVRCYDMYAQTYLQEHELILPRSEHVQ